MIAAGIDLGGTKVEAQVFAPDWSVAERRRVSTPDDYKALLAVLTDLTLWTEEVAGKAVPLGVGSAGLVNPVTGFALAANLPITGRPFPADINMTVGRPVAYLNDARAMVLSEAVFGAGRAHSKVAGLIIGTGVGGGFAVDGRLQTGPSGAGGEFGHTSASAQIVAKHKLPIWQCGCGLEGCIETYVSGPGLERLALQLTGKVMTVREVADARDGDAEQVWQVWCELVADLLHRLMLTLDPDVVVFGGGLSKIEGVTDDLMDVLRASPWGSYWRSDLVIARSGDTSGARGAAFAAWQERASYVDQA